MGVLERPWSIGCRADQSEAVETASGGEESTGAHSQYLIQFYLLFLMACSEIQ